MSDNSYDIAIIGGGASGLMAASLLSRDVDEKNPSIIIFEKHLRVGKKLLATGNGTCNITNLNAMDVSHYYGDKKFASGVLKKNNPEMIMNYFEEIGLSIDRNSAREGRVYPTCLQASAVLDCLRLSYKNVTECCDSVVISVENNEQSGGFSVEAILPQGKRNFGAKILIVATGGAATPALGNGRNAYDILLNLGYSKTDLLPSIVQIKTDTNVIKAVKGIRVGAEVALVVNNEKIAKSSGELLFTEYGLSGPVILDISRFVSMWERGTSKKNEMFAEIDLLPQFDFNMVREDVLNRVSMGRKVEDLLTGLVNKRVGQMVLRYAGVTNQNVLASTLSRLDINKIVTAIKKFSVKVVSTRGLNSAQVTAGGVNTKDFNPETMESKSHKNLFVLGEVLNVDGECGGYNLQWAWACAHVAALEIGKRI